MSLGCKLSPFWSDPSMLHKCQQGLKADCVDSKSFCSADTFLSLTQQAICGSVWLTPALSLPIGDAQWIFVVESNSLRLAGLEGLGELLFLQIMAWKIFLYLTFCPCTYKKYFPNKRNKTLQERFKKTKGRRWKVGVGNHTVLILLSCLPCFFFFVLTC